MIRALINSLREWRVLRAMKGGFRDDLQSATSRRSQAYAELRAAESAGDCRRIGPARMKLSQATHDQLANEVWG